MGLSVPTAWVLYIVVVVVVFIVLKRLGYGTSLAFLFAVLLGAIVVLVLNPTVEINTQTDQAWYNTLVVVAVGILLLAVILTVFFCRQYKEVQIPKKIYSCDGDSCKLVEQVAYCGGEQQVFRYN